MVNEKRLIDANVLDEKCRRQMADEWNQRVAPVSWAEAYKEFLDDIWDATAVDVVEVVHSQWDTVFYERNGTLASYSHICPKCKYFYRDLRFKGHNYCPNCGAKMDGGVDYGSK